MVVSFVCVSAPQFVVGILLLYVFAVHLGWFPIGGYGSFANLVLPSLTLGILGAGWYSRMMRSSMIDVLRQDFIRTARAKGLGPATVIAVHALPNAILPIIAMIGIDIGYFMSGIVVVESVFGWPGIGQLAWQAIQRVDIPIIMGVTLVSACAIVRRQSRRRSGRAADRSADQVAVADGSALGIKLQLNRRNQRAIPAWDAPLRESSKMRTILLAGAVALALGMARRLRRRHQAGRRDDRHLQGRRHHARSGDRLRLAELVDRSRACSAG